MPDLRYPLVEDQQTSPELLLPMLPTIADLSVVARAGMARDHQVIASDLRTKPGVSAAALVRRAARSSHGL